MLIYKATNLINEKVYIGQTINNLKKRKRDHISNALNKENNMYFHRAIRKYGSNSFTWKILQECDTIEELNRLEIYYIDLYNTFKNGYNLTLGGNSIMGFKHSEETKKRMSEAAKGRKLSKDQIQRLSEINKGKKLSEETRRRISESLRGKHHTKESIKKMSDAKKDKGCVPIIINGKHFGSRKQAAEFMDVAPSTIRQRILHKTKWLNYSYV